MRIDKLVIAGIVSMSMLASCAGSDNGKSPTEPASPVNFTLSLTGAPVTTKTAIATDPNATAYITSESTINNLVVGLFDANSNLVTLTPLAGTALSGGKVYVTGNSLVTKAAVAVNVPSSFFSGVKKLSDFEGVQANLDYTASNDASAAGTAGQFATALPMAGEGIVTITPNGTSSASGAVIVPLTRMVSKITLSGITTSFSGVYAAATFTPTEVFMYNVSPLANCNTNTTTSAINLPTVSTAWLHGEQVTPVVSAITPKNYLGTAALSGTAKTLPWSGYYTFYVFPNNSATIQTELMIKGDFCSDGTNATKTTVYYPIIINHAMAGTTFTGTTGGNPDGGIGNDGVIQNNRVFNLTATITSQGTTNPAQPINTANVTVTVSVNSWPTIINQSATF
jgi:hypothetical protein